MKSVEKMIQEIAEDLISNRKIDIFSGYEKAGIPLMSRPYFIDASDEDSGKLEKSIKKLVWNSFCSNNLAVYLPEFFKKDSGKPNNREVKIPKIGIVAKACDMRSIIGLIKEKQILKENIITIGVPCRGMIDKRKVENAFSGREITSADETTEGILNITTSKNDKYRLNREEYIQEVCLSCRFPMPENVDYLIPGESRHPGDGGYGEIHNFENKSSDERWEYFKQEISKCIRCNACRQACPNCWCRECFADQSDPRWIGTSIDLSDTMIFHLIRIFHQAGRCVECDACYRACPMGVDLRTFTKKVAKDVNDLFDFVPGFSTEEPSPMSTFKEDDSDDFTTEP
jgi:formate dehydrogenase (coenzyme F420) beta subunit